MSATTLLTYLHILRICKIMTMDMDGSLERLVCILRDLSSTPRESRHFLWPHASQPKAGQTP